VHHITRATSYQGTASQYFNHVMPTLAVQFDLLSQTVERLTGLKAGSRLERARSAY
jgi:hypothetical protein